MRKSVVLLSLVFISQAASAEEEPSPATHEIRAGIGARSMVPAGLLALPFTIVLINSIDIGKFFRMQVDVSPYNFVEEKRFLRASFSAGAALKVYGSHTKQTGGLEIVVPALVESAYMSGDGLEAGDGYSETIKWFLVGPSSGADLTYWFNNGIGFNASLKAGYLLLTADMGSEYEADYSWYDDTDGFLDLALTIGIAL